jgi:C-terminal processing protease CtpA/Prc
VAGDSKTLVGRGLKAGVGLVLSQHPHNGDALISQVVPFGPAARSGTIHLGDAITSVSGVSTKGLSLSQVSSMLEGTINSAVDIVVSRFCQTTGGPITVPKNTTTNHSLHSAQNSRAWMIVSESDLLFLARAPDARHHPPVGPLFRV